MRARIKREGIPERYCLQCAGAGAWRYDECGVDAGMQAAAMRREGKFVVFVGHMTHGSANRSPEECRLGSLPRGSAKYNFSGCKSIISLT